MSNNSMFSKPRTLTETRAYETNRFDSSKRMQSLDKIEKKFAQELMEIVGKEATIADLPCGSGRFTSIFAQGSVLYNIDLSENMLQTIQERYPSSDKMQFIHASVQDVPLENETVDLAFCMRLLHHVTNPEDRIQILTELARITKTWVATSYYRTECFRVFKKKLFGKKISGNPIPTKTFKSEAQQAGLKVVRLIPSYLNGSAQTLVLLQKC